MGLALTWALGPAGELSCPWSSWCVSLLSRGQIGKTGRGRATGLLGPRSPTENSCFVLAGFLPLPFTPEEQTAPESSSLTVANLHCTFRVFVPEPRLKGQRYPGRAVQRTAGARGPGRASPRCRRGGGHSVCRSHVAACPAASGAGAPSASLPWMQRAQCWAGRGFSHA